MNLIKLLDIANPKKIKDTLNLLITTYDGFDDEIRNIAKAAQKDASDALNNSATALSTVNTANANASAAKQTSEEALTMIEAADQRSEEATQTAETALNNANTATQTAELAMNLATQAKSTVDQAISTGVFGTFVHNPAGISLLHAYLTNDINQEDTAENTYVATPTLVKNALEAYLPLAGGQLTGALKIASGYDKGIQDSEGNNLLYMSSDYVLNIRNEAYNDINIGGPGAGEITIGGSRITSDINVIGRSFSYNDKSVAVTSDIPKTLNNKTLVANGNTTIYGTDITLASDNTSNVTDAINNTNTRIDNLTTTVNGKADTSAIPTALSQLSEDTTHRVVTDTEKATWNAKSDFDGDYNSLTNKPTIPDPSKLLTTDTAQDITGVKTYQSAPELYNRIPIYGTIGSGASKSKYRLLEYYQIASNSHWVEVGSQSQLLNLVGSSTRPRYSTTEHNRGNDLALYSDIKSGIKSYLTSNATTGSGTSGSLQLTLGHLYILYIVDGIHTFRTLVRLGTDSSKTQYWYLGIGAYGHYMRLYILGNGTVTYQYANVGKTNWTDNLSIAIYYDDITGQ